MNEQEIEKTFSDRIYEFCLLKDIKQTDLVDAFSKHFNKQWLEKCFDGKLKPSDVLVAGLSRYFNTSVDSFFEAGERVVIKADIIPAQQKRKINHLEEVLNIRIEYDDKNYNDVLRKYVKIALGKELISFSRAASILNVSLKEVREL